MKRICMILVLLLVLSGCSKNNRDIQPPRPTTEVTEQPAAVTTPQLVTFDIYAINDLHGKFADSSTQPGVDELTTYLKDAQQAGNTILLSTGDMWQGSSESNLTGGNIITEWMNELDFAAMTIGGHEYDWGEAQIRQNLELAEFPFLAINIFSRETNERVDYCQSSRIIEIEGAQIGIIGAVGDCSRSVAAENIQNVYFKVGDELTGLIEAESKKLRREGVDFIILAIHDGYDQNYDGTNPIAADDLPYYDTALSSGYVDLVFEADSHFTYVLQDQHGVYHLQAGGNNAGISHASVLLDITNGDSLVFTAELIENNNYRFSEADPLVEQLLDKYAEQIAPANRILGTNKHYRSSKQLCQLVADLYCAKGMEKWGKQYDIVLGGGYISTRSPGYMDAGEISYSLLQSLLPFDNDITLCSISGRDLIDKFLETDHQSYYIKTTTYGERIRTSIDPDATYYVVTDSYTSDYSYNNLTVIATYDAEIYARDLLAEYIEKGGLS